MRSVAWLLGQTGSSGSEGPSAITCVDQIAPQGMCQQAAYRLVRLTVRLGSAVLSSGHASTVVA